MVLNSPVQPNSRSAPKRSIQLVCDYYLPEVHAGVVDYAREAGWMLSDWKCHTPLRIFDDLEEFDGYLTISASPELNEWLKKRKRPIVRLTCSDQELDCAAVEPDCVAIGVKTAEHLLTLGAPDLAFYRCCGVEESMRIWRGFSQTLAAAGREAHFIDFSTCKDFPDPLMAPRRDRWDWFRAQLEKLPKPLAILVEDDRFANDVFVVAGEAGWRIPEDIALLSIDNRELVLGKYPIGVSSLDSNLRGIGRAGAALLDQILNGATPPNAPVLVQPGEVIVRQSTATFVCDHPGVTSAVKYLRSHYNETIQIPDVARIARISPRSLQAAFKEIVGRTITEELSELRLGHASRLLRETDLKLESVAHESGLKNAKYLCEVFREVFKATPTAYREAQKQLNSA